MSQYKYMVGNQTFDSKNAAYRECRRLNGKKAGGRRPYNVQRSGIVVENTRKKR